MELYAKEVDEDRWDRQDRLDRVMVLTDSEVNEALTTLLDKANLTITWSGRLDLRVTNGEGDKVCGATSGENILLTSSAYKTSRHDLRRLILRGNIIGSEDVDENHWDRVERMTDPEVIKALTLLINAANLTINWVGRLELRVETGEGDYVCDTASGEDTLMTLAAYKNTRSELRRYILRDHKRNFMKIADKRARLLERWNENASSMARSEFFSLFFSSDSIRLPMITPTMCIRDQLESQEGLIPFLRGILAQAEALANDPRKGDVHVVGGKLFVVAIDTEGPKAQYVQLATREEARMFMIRATPSSPVRKELLEILACPYILMVAHDATPDRMRLRTRLLGATGVPTACYWLDTQEMFKVMRLSETMTYPVSLTGMAETLLGRNLVKLRLPYRTDGERARFFNQFEDGRELTMEGRVFATHDACFVRMCFFTMMMKAMSHLSLQSRDGSHLALSDLISLGPTSALAHHTRLRLFGPTDEAEFVHVEGSSRFLMMAKEARGALYRMRMWSSVDKEAYAPLPPKRIRPREDEELAVHCAGWGIRTQRRNGGPVLTRTLVPASLSAPCALSATPCETPRSGDEEAVLSSGGVTKHHRQHYETTIRKWVNDPHTYHHLLALLFSALSYTQRRCDEDTVGWEWLEVGDLYDFLANFLQTEQTVERFDAIYEEQTVKRFDAIYEVVVKEHDNMRSSFRDWERDWECASIADKQTIQIFLNDETRRCVDF